MNYFNLMEISSGFKCPRKTHFNPQCPPPLLFLISTVPVYCIGLEYTVHIDKRRVCCHLFLNLRKEKGQHDFVIICYFYNLSCKTVYN